MLKRIYFGGFTGMLIALYIGLILRDPTAMLAGAGWDGSGEDGYSLFTLVYWLILLLPVWLSCLWQIEDELLRAHMVLYRYKRLSQWWLHIRFRACITLIFSYLCMGICLKLLMGSEWHPLMSASMGILMLHAMGLAGAAIYIRILTGNMIIAAGTVMILEVTAKILTVLKLSSPVYNFFSWGMAVYSRPLYGRKGYLIPAVIMIQLLLLAGTGIFSHGQLKDVLLRRLTDAKND